MFEVGKKVICIKNHSQGVVKKGQVFELLGIKKGHCKCASVVVDVGIIDDEDYGNATRLRCAKCRVVYHNDKSNIWWLSADLFAPYDDSLSDLTVEDILEETLTHII